MAYEDDYPEAPDGTEESFPAPDNMRALWGEGLVLDTGDEFAGAEEITYDDLGDEKQYHEGDEVEAQSFDDEDDADEDGDEGDDEEVDA
jgi:hypothetical protein